MPTDPKAQPMTDKIEVEQIDLRFAEDAIPEDVFASIPQYLNVRTYVARAFARHRQSSSAVGDAGLRADYGSANSWAFEDRIIAKGECIAFASEPWTNRILAALQSQPGAVTGDARPLGYARMGSTGRCDFEQLREAIAEATTGVRGLTDPWPAEIYPGHVGVEGINYNSLSRIVTAFVDAALSAGPQGEEHPLARMVALDEEIEADNPGYMDGEIGK